MRSFSCVVILKCEEEEEEEEERWQCFCSVLSIVILAQTHPLLTHSLTPSLLAAAAERMKGMEQNGTGRLRLF